MSFASPCLLPMLPVYVLYFAGETPAARWTVAVRAVFFTFGFAAVFVTLGVFAGSLGAVLSAHQRLVDTLVGAAIVLLGLGYLAGIHFPALAGGTRRVKIRGFASAFGFGMAFALMITPCVGAFLGSALSLAASSGTVLKGAALLGVYSAGLGIPFLLSALLLEELKCVFAWVKTHYRLINAGSGILLIAIGIGHIVNTSGMLKREIGKEPSPVPAAADQSQEKIKMEITLNEENFEAEVLKSDKPVLVDFWAPWCGPCRMLGPIIAEVAAERAGTLKVGKVNVDEAPNLAAKYGVMSIPALFLFKNGEVAAQAVGFMSKPELEARLLGR